MKKLFNIFSLALLAAPQFANAQWSAVRFDQYNTFQTVHNPTANNVFVLGNEPMNYDCFLIRSNTSGSSWDSVSFNTASDTYQFSELYFVDADNGFVGGIRNNTNQVLMKSIDNGSTWTDVTPQPSSTEMISALFFVDPLTGFATAGSTFYSTSDGGATWNSSTLAFIPADLNFINASVGYAAGTIGAGTTSLVMKTTDGGATWNEVYNQVDPMVFTNGCDHLNVLNQYVAFASQPYTNKIFRTMDGGVNWNTIVCDSVYDIIDFQFISPNIGQILSSFGQLYSTDDGGLTWKLEYATDWAFYGPSNYFYSLSFADGVGFVCGTNGLVKRFEKNQTSIENLNSKYSALHVFPNPCSNSQNVSIATTGVSGDCLLFVVNALGQKVFTQNIDDLEENEVIQLARLNLSAGIYNVVLKSGKDIHATSVVVKD